MATQILTCFLLSQICLTERGTVIFTIGKEAIRKRKKEGSQGCSLVPTFSVLEAAATGTSLAPGKQSTLIHFESNSKAKISLVPSTSKCSSAGSDRIACRRRLRRASRKRSPPPERGQRRSSTCKNQPPRRELKQ
jgi:hypothetical protein